MNPPASLLADLQHHFELATAALRIVTEESVALRNNDESKAKDLRAGRRQLLTDLTGALDRLRQHRHIWLALPSSERAARDAERRLMRDLQDLLMKVMMMDRENEQLLLRRGLVPPQHLPPAERQRPHFVADLYRRRGSG
jgi:hypothetical protein